MIPRTVVAADSRRKCRRRRPAPTCACGARSAARCGNVDHRRRTPARYGIGGVIAGAATIFFAYIGFEAVSTAGAESKNPARDMPIGILGSLIICTILYILTCGVLVGIVPYTELNDPAPIAMAVNHIGLPLVRDAGEDRRHRGPFVGDAGAALRPDAHLLHHGARRPAAVAVRAACTRSSRRRGSTRSSSALLAVGFAGFMGLDALANLTNVGTLAAFAIVCITVIYLRFTRPEHETPVQDAAAADHHGRATRRSDVRVPADVADGARADAQLLPDLPGGRLRASISSTACGTRSSAPGADKGLRIKGSEYLSGRTGVADAG